MTWFKVDDKLHSHRKIINLSFAALGLWTRAGSWCADHESNGRLPKHLLRTFKAPPRLARELVSAGLWLEETESFLFKNWISFQPTSDQLSIKRDRWKQQKQRQRAPVSTMDTFECPPDPVPSRPDPLNSHSNGRELNPFLCVSSDQARARELSGNGNIETDRRRGSDFMLAATCMSWQGYDRELAMIGGAPEAERAAVLRSIQTDAYEQANLTHCDPKHVLRKWNQYANGNKARQLAAANTSETELWKARIAESRTRLAELAQKRAQLKREHPDYLSHLYDLDRLTREETERLERRKRELHALSG